MENLEKDLMHKLRVSKNIVHENMQYSFLYKYKVGPDTLKKEKSVNIKLFFELKRSVNYKLFCTILLDDEKYKNFETSIDFLNRINFIAVKKSVKQKKVIESKFNFKVNEIFNF